MYFITTIDSTNDDTRCVGYFKDFEEAEIRVLENAMDICETCYDYAVIENVPEGLYQYDQNAKWYKFDYDKNVYRKIEGRPAKYERIVGLAIG